MDFLALKVDTFSCYHEHKSTGERMPFKRRRDVISGTRQNKIHMVYYSFLIKSSIN